MPFCRVPHFVGNISFITKNNSICNPVKQTGKQQMLKAFGNKKFYLKKKLFSKQLVLCYSLLLNMVQDKHQVQFPLKKSINKINSWIE